MQQLRPYEEAARRMMEADLRVPVVQHDDGSRDSMYDLSVLYPNGPAGAAEVVAAADGEAIALWNLINPGGRWIVPELAGGWSVHFEIGARGRRIRSDLPQLLMSLESSGVTSLDTRRGDGRFHSGARSGPAERRYRRDVEGERLAELLGVSFNPGRPRR